ncbi:MAG: hypothetical protein CL831_03275 [Crocinitomicaceae bacterium]|nr:hypothetical protein [Crocinitomicaceae bacterium]
MGVIHHRTSIAFSKRVSAIVFMATFLCAFALQGQSDTLPTPTDFHAVTILPFFMDLVEEEDAPPARRELRMREIALENMHGIQWAAERLSNEGYHIELGFFDEVADTLGKNHWGIEDIYDADVIFGPLQLSPISISRRIIERTGAEHILLTPLPSAFLRGSDAIRTVIPSQVHAVDVMARDVAEKHSQDNVVFVMSGGNDLELEERFLDVFNRELQADTIYADSLLFDTVQASRNSIGSLSDKLDYYSRNVIVSLAGRSSRSMLSNLQAAVQINDSTEIFVYTHPELKDLGFIDVTFLERTRTTLPVSEEVNWSDSATIAAVKLFQSQFNTHPSKYSIRAHDAFLDAFTRKLERDLGPKDFSVLPAPIATVFDWVAVDQFSGYVNKHWKLKTFYQRQWCESENVPTLLDFIEPEKD